MSDQRLSRSSTCAHEEMELSMADPSGTSLAAYEEVHMSSQSQSSG